MRQLSRLIRLGGIADGAEQLAAAFTGLEWSSKIQMGTRFVASKESIVHENYKNQI